MAYVSLMDPQLRKAKIAVATIFDFRSRLFDIKGSFIATSNACHLSSVSLHLVFSKMLAV